MAVPEAFNSIVAARTRAAAHILGSKELLGLFEDKGGLKEDLVEVRDFGLKAEALNQAQSEAQAAGGAATMAVLEGFAELQKEYKAVMAIVQAVRHDLAVAKADKEVIAAIDKILVNEAEVALHTIKGQAVVEGEKPKKRAAARVTQEALRAEIQKDAAALLGLKAAHAALARRRLDAKRLGRLKSAAEALAGKLAERTAKKGEGKTATGAERDAVTAQKQRWAASYRILAALGREEPRIGLLLRDAAAKK